MTNIILTQSPSAMGTIRQLSQKIRPGQEVRVIASYDDYSHGPLSMSGTARDFVLDRQAFWKSLDLQDADIMHDFDPVDDHIALMNEVRSAAKVEIWIAGTVQDLFYAAVIAHLLTSDEIDVSSISVRYLDGEQARWGLGGITVEDLETLYESSKSAPLDPELYRDLWSAISKGSGRAVKRFIDEHDPSTPVVKTLSAYLLRFPDFNDGLGSIERALLGAGTDELKKSAYTVGIAMAKMVPEIDSIGDLILFRRLVEFGRMSPDPWFKLEGDLRLMRGCSAQITESGRKARVRYSVSIL